MKNHVLKTSLGLATLAISLATQASPVSSINWGTGAQAISGDSDVSTSGTLVAAFNLGSAGVPSVTVNGVTFDPFAFPANYTAAGVTNGNYSFTENAGALVSFSNLGTATAPFGNLSTSYESLLSSSGASDNSATLSLLLKGLTTGKSYQFQWWDSDASLAKNDKSTSFSTIAAAGNSVTLNPNTTSAIGGLGQFAIGTFTASGPTMIISFNATGNDDPAINAFQLRDLSVPEPSTWALFGMGAILLAMGQRRPGRPLNP